jgi:signal peptidase I
MSPAVSGRRAGLLLVSLITGFMLVPLAGVTVAQPWHVEGHSMEPSLEDGSILLVDGLGPRVTGYARGDIVIVPLPAAAAYPHPVLVKPSSRSRATTS